MKRKNKSKWKGGLIGAGIGWFWLAIAPINYFNLFYVKLNQNVLNVPIDWFLFSYLPIIEHLVLGFLIGYFIQNKLLKRKR